MSDVPEQDVTLEPSQELYIPEAKLNSNVKRMAWLLFLEWWKDAVKDKGMENTMEAEKLGTAYEICVTAAKLVWHEQEKGYGQME